MMEHKIEIGARVRLKKYRDLPNEYQHHGAAKVVGKKGEIVDIMWSNARQREVYKIMVDGAKKVSSIEYTIDCFYLIPTAATYGFEIDVLEDRVNVVFCEYKDESRTELSRSYGHLIEDGTAAIAQAASFAMFRLYKDIGGIACCRGGKVKGKMGCAICLAEVDDNGNNVAVCAGLVDGKTLLEDVWYTVKNGKFVEYKEDEE